MKIIIIIKTALRAIRKHVIRSLLSVLGISIGIAAVVTTFSIGTAAEKKVHSQILAMGENAGYIIPGNIVERGSIRESQVQPRQKLTTDDLALIRTQFNTELQLSRGFQEQKRIEFSEGVATVSTSGVDPNIFVINDLELEKGNFFKDIHIQNRANVVVLGNKIARSLFKTMNPIGATVNIGKKPFFVIGVLQNIRMFWGTQDPNDRIYIPYTTAKKYFQRPWEAKNQLDFIAFKVAADQPTAPAVRKLKRILRFAHDIKPDEQDDFTIFDEDLLDTAATQASYNIKLFGLIAALLALLVGGIGIMNIMLVAVIERKKEIGIKLSIGATRRAIRQQFLYEAIILSLCGGVIGIGLSIVVVCSLCIMLDLQITIDCSLFTVALLLTIVTGIFFGYYPAYKASQLNPVDALYAT